MNSKKTNNPKEKWATQMTDGAAIHRRASVDGEQVEGTALPLPSDCGNTDEDHENYVGARDPAGKNIRVWPCKTGSGDREIDLFLCYKWTCTCADCFGCISQQMFIAREPASPLLDACKKTRTGLSTATL